MPEDMLCQIECQIECQKIWSDRMPEDLPVTKCINVMVGITRSKVFFFISMLSRDVVRLSQKIKKSLAELSSRHLAFGYDCPRPDYSGDKKKRKHQSMEGNIRTSDIRTARFKQLSLVVSSTKSRKPNDPCSCPRPGHYPDTAGVSISAPRRSGWGVVGRVGREAVAWVPGGGLPAVAQPVPPLLLGRLPDGEPLLLLLGSGGGGGCSGPGGCRLKATGRPFPGGWILLAFPTSSFASALTFGLVSFAFALAFVPPGVGVVYKDTLWAPVSTAKWSIEVEKGVGDLESGETLPQVHPKVWATSLSEDSDYCPWH